MQIAINGRKKRLNASFSHSKKNTNKSNTNTYSSPKIETVKDSILKDSVIRQSSFGFGASSDTVIRIYYADLTDSVLKKHKNFIKAFVKRSSVKSFSEITLTDFFSEEGFTDKSIKIDIEKYLIDIGVSKHRLFWRRNKRVKIEDSTKKPKNLLYLEIHFY